MNTAIGRYHDPRLILRRKLGGRIEDAVDDLLPSFGLGHATEIGSQNAAPTVDGVALCAADAPGEENSASTTRVASSVQRQLP